MWMMYYWSDEIFPEYMVSSQMYDIYQADDIYCKGILFPEQIISFRTEKLLTEPNYYYGPVFCPGTVPIYFDCKKPVFFCPLWYLVHFHPLGTCLKSPCLIDTKYLFHILLVPSNLSSSVRKLNGISFSENIVH